MTEDVEKKSEEEHIEKEASEDVVEKEANSKNVEDLAREIGWNPEYEGDDAVDAATYILKSRDITRGQSKKIKNLGKEIEALREGVGTIQSHLETKHAAEVKRLEIEISHLKNQRKEAVEEGDSDKVYELDERIENLSENTKTTVPKTNYAPNYQYIEWEEENKWFNDDLEMRQWANAYSQTPELNAMKSNPATYKRFLNTITEMARKVFPDRFQKEEKKPNAAVVASPTPKRQKQTKATSKDLTFEQRKVGEDFISQGIYKNLDEYAEKLQSRYGEK